MSLDQAHASLKKNVKQSSKEELQSLDKKIEAMETKTLAGTILKEGAHAGKSIMEIYRESPSYFHWIVGHQFENPKFRMMVHYAQRMAKETKGYKKEEATPKVKKTGETKSIPEAEPSLSKSSSDDEEFEMLNQSLSSHQKDSTTSRVTDLDTISQMLVHNQQHMQQIQEGVMMVQGSCASMESRVNTLETIVQQLAALQTQPRGWDPAADTVTIKMQSCCVSRLK